jgi:hypothetical protein
MKMIGKSRDFATNERGAFAGFRGESRAICLAHYASVHHPTSPTALKKSCRSFDGAFDVLKCVDGSIAIYCYDCDDCDSETNNTSGWEQLATRWLKAGAEVKKIADSWRQSVAALPHPGSEAERLQAYDAYQRAEAAYQNVRAALRRAETELLKICAL